MQQDVIEKIKNNPKYRELVSKRTRFAWILSIIMLIVYYAFILIIAFDPQLLATKLSADSIITLGIPLGVLIIMIAFVLTGIYVWRANGEFDTLTQQIKEELK
jgi:uncharacterized membrane protein (DUF485 family)